MAVFTSLLVLYCVIYSTAATSQLIVNPSRFNAMNGPALTVNCTFHYSNSSNIVSLTSIFLSKGDDQRQENSSFTEIASVTFSAPSVVNVLTTVNASTSGLVNKDGQSFLSLYWEHPSLNEEGLYQCNITGLDRTGKCVEISHTSKVTAHKPTVDQLIENDRQQHMQMDDVRISLDTIMNKYRLLENIISNMNTSLEIVLTQQTALENTLTNLTTTVTHLLELPLNESLTDTSSQFAHSQTVSTFFHISSEYNGKYYRLSKLRNVNVNDSQIVCEQAGGYLAEIEDAGEQSFIATFLYTKAVKDVLIGGTDEGHEGQWIWRTGQRAVSYSNWFTHRPLNKTDMNCIGLLSRYNWQWYDAGCKDGRYYLCEMPKL